MELLLFVVELVQLVDLLLVVVQLERNIAVVELELEHIVLEQQVQLLALGKVSVVELVELLARRRGHQVLT